MNSCRFFLVCSVVVGILGFSNGCKKDEIHPDPPTCDTTYFSTNSLDTLFPSHHLMTYPGSWWTYSDGSSDTAFAWKNLAVIGIERQDDCVSFHSDNQVVVRTSYGLVGGVNGYRDRGFDRTTEVSVIIDTTIGKTFYDYSVSSGSGHDRTTSYRSKKVEDRVRSMDINGITFTDVVTVKESWGILYHHVGGGPSGYSYKWYAKGVGLVKLFEHENGCEKSMEIVDFHIAPH